MAACIFLAAQEGRFGVRNRGSTGLAAAETALLNLRVNPCVAPARFCMADTGQGANPWSDSPRRLWVAPAGIA